MKNESEKMLNIIHANNKQAQAKERIENQLKAYREKQKQEKERKEELSEARSLTMVIIALILLYMYFIGLI